ncbi:CBS domain-containing protein [Natronoarchaeum philippinense]|uniref:CBS domain-containing protein n=1 Tax=Natronoarchaeum philippinense TaxID=558529 RepID=A0A285NC53_NATPI|nr:CBS domain-containing protein [Natronoarchaeum philippinense]SNZ06517.1 CBS domain-containing protein [Natronoarchaeum philippinense]
MDISGIASQQFAEVDVETRLGKVRSLFDDENPKGIIVTRDGEYAGVVGERDLLQSHVEDDAKVGSHIKPSRNDPAPKIDRTENIRDVARKLVEGGTKVAPVLEDGELWGIITADAILEAVIENLDALTVEQIYTDQVIAVGEDDGIGKAINRLREHGVSRLPVLNENGYLSGVITTHDISEIAVRKSQRQTTGDRSGDADRIMDVPVYDAMSSPVETTTVDTSVRDAVQQMLDSDFGGLVVTPEDDDRNVVGVLTKTDVLRALSYTEEEQMDVQITNIQLLDTLSRQDVRDAITQVADKYRKMQVQHVHVRFHKHKEKLRGTPLIQAQIRMRTNKGQLAGTGEGYGADNAFHVALDKLERNVLERKGMISDEEHRGQLLRKLGEL